ncbi:transporter, partial [Leifsonia sp. SIMBA_070]
MSALTLLIIAVAGVAVLLLAVIKFKIPAFLALLTVSVLVAVAAGIPLNEVVAAVQAGMG